MYRSSTINQLHAHPAGVTAYLASAVRDAAGVNQSPGAVALAAGRIVAAGEVETVKKALPADARIIELPGRLLIPGLVNAHAHLDLTNIGHLPYAGSFIEWVKTIIRRRPREAADIADAVQRGAQLSRAAGVLTIGDIAGDLPALEALARSGLAGVSFIELLGLDEGSVDHLHRISRAVASPALAGSAVRPGIQPHAPYSTGPFIYGPAQRLARQVHAPLSTHLAETPEEAQFVADAAGPFRDLLEQMGKWDDRLLDHYGQGYSPVDWLARHITGPILLAHCNYVGDDQIRLMAARDWSVAYCPRASDYFGHRGHRYRDMLEAGVNVCLGTDSIVCHGTLSVLDEMRHLFGRDGVSPGLLLKMATTSGMRGLGLEPEQATFAPGASPGVVAVSYDPRSAVDPLEQVLAAEDAAIEVVAGR